MKKLLLLSLAYAFACLAVKAQITITLSDIQLGPNTVITAKDTSTFIQPGPSGANQVWDFSGFAPSQHDTVTSDMSSFTSNPLFPTASHAMCQTASGMSYCYYYDIDATGVYGLGLEQTMTVPYASHTVATYAPAAMGYPLPLNFNQIATQACVLTQQSTNGSPAPYDSVRIVYSKGVTLNVDGWGIVKTPFGTYNALRVQKINTNSDTSYYHTAAGGWAAPQVNAIHKDTAYTWLATGAFEVANMTTYSSTVHRYSFSKSTSTTSIKDRDLQSNEFKLFPNPATDNLYIQSNTGIRSVICKNIVGQACAIAMSGSSVDVSKLAQGVYFLTLVDEKGAVQTQKFVKQ